MARKMLGQYIVADSEICHGKPTFAGTRIMVSQILGMAARGLSWDQIIDDWDGKVSKEAISEAMALATQLFVAHESEYIENNAPAA